jgi:hypothetical protein
MRIRAWHSLKSDLFAFSHILAPSDDGFYISLMKIVSFEIYLQVFLPQVSLYCKSAKHADKR